MKQSLLIIGLSLLLAACAAAGAPSVSVSSDDEPTDERTSGLTVGKQELQLVE